MKIDIEAALAIRKALEPLTVPMVSEPDDDDINAYELLLTSVAISLRRVADALEKQNKLITELTNVEKMKR